MFSAEVTRAKGVFNKWGRFSAARPIRVPLDGIDFGQFDNRTFIRKSIISAGRFFGDSLNGRLLHKSLYKSI